MNNFNLDIDKQKIYTIQIRVPRILLKLGRSRCSVHHQRFRPGGKTRVVGFCWSVIAHGHTSSNQEKTIPATEKKKHRIPTPPKTKKAAIARETPRAQDPGRCGRAPRGSFARPHFGTPRLPSERERERRGVRHSRNRSINGFRTNTEIFLPDDTRIHPHQTATARGTYASEAWISLIAAITAGGSVFSGKSSPAGSKSGSSARAWYFTSPSSM